jgi:phosphate-selective porin OprO and OprP
MARLLRSRFVDVLPRFFFGSLVFTFAASARAQSTPPPPEPPVPEPAQVAPEPAQVAPEPAQVKIDSSGLLVSSADKAYTFSAKFVLQTDARIFIDDEHKLTDGFSFRAVRPILEGTVAKAFSYRFMPDFADGKVVLFDAYADAKVTPWLRVRAGKFKVPFGLERLKAETTVTFAERAYPTSLAPVRDVGLMIHGEGWGGALMYAVGVLNGQADGGNADLDQDDSKEIAVRLATKPFARANVSLVKGLVVGVAGTRGEKTGTPASPYLGSYRSFGQNTYFSYLVDAGTPPAGAATTVAQGVGTRATVHAFVPVGPFALLGEYAWSQQRVVRSGISHFVSARAWQVAGAFVLTGEDETLDGITPKNALDLSAGRVGAIELALRYSELRMGPSAFPAYADDKKSARDAAEVVAGFNWYPNANVKVTADYAQTRFRGGATPSITGERDTEQVVTSRLQLSF